MCCEEEDVQYRTVGYVCECRREYELDLQCHPFEQPREGEYAFRCLCGRTSAESDPAGMAGTVVAYRLKEQEAR